MDFIGEGCGNKFVKSKEPYYDVDKPNQADTIGGKDRIIFCSKL